MNWIFDVGMHNGDDTAYYLARGFNVVAVEANPALCEAARERFATEIASERLFIRNTGIAEDAGERDFWVSDNTEWSSFHRENATKGGARSTSIRVPVVRFADLLLDYPMPIYIKIDIEMNDTHCLRELTRCPSLPQYVSFEGHLEAVADIEFLSQPGYPAFKCIRQNDWREITPRNAWLHGELRKAMARSRVARFALRRFVYARQPLSGWVFPLGSSGPLAQELPGRWLTKDQMVAVWESLLKIDRELEAGGLGQWFDIHAASRIGPEWVPPKGGGQANFDESHPSNPDRRANSS